MIGIDPLQVKANQRLVHTLILASTSPYRRSLLERIAPPFEVMSPHVDEAHLPGETPRGRAARLSLAKARAVAERHPKAIVIGSDQVAASELRVLDRPGDEATCRAQLTSLSGQTARFYTGCAVVGIAAGLSQEYLDVTTVVFRTLTEAEINRYVARERPFDCAGGFKVEALGITLFDRMDTSDPTALIGLPLIWLASALRKAGYLLP
ncbi:MAG: Maf family protein [Gammaproteobacteria bacterium]